MDEKSTIAAVATAPGRGGVAVVRVSGPEAFAIASALTDRRVDAARAGRFFHATLRHGGKTLDDGLVLVFAAPASYTGEDVVEFQTHGGVVAPRRVLAACLACGARLARRGEFTQRAFLNGRLDISEAEAVIDLVDAKTDRAADDAVARLGGAAARADAALYAAALDISSRLEHALDFSEDELPPGYIEEVGAAIADLAARIADERKRLREGRILREGALVVLAGPPNAGKSSLLNALLGERRAIVSAEAGTTRDSIEEWLDVKGWPVRLVDTAGLRRAADAVEAEGVGRAEELISRADLVVALDLDVPGALRIHSKCDLERGEGLNVSAVTGEGLDALKEAIAARLAARAASGDEPQAEASARRGELLAAAQEALALVAPGAAALVASGAAALVAADTDLVLAANGVRTAAESLGRLAGKVYADDLLDALFSRFCIGK